MHTLAGPDVVGPKALTTHGFLFQVKDLNVSYFHKLYKTHDHMNTLVVCPSQAREGPRSLSFISFMGNPDVYTSTW